MDRSRGQMYSLVTMPKATKLISTLSPNTAGGVMSTLTHTEIIAARNSALDKSRARSGIGDHVGVS